MDKVAGHGIDMVQCCRIKQLGERYGVRFLQRVFTANEIEYCRVRKRNWEHLAGRFAVKEAVLKALGTGWRGRIAWTDVEIINDKLGRPTVQLAGHTLKLSRDMRVREIHVSISHTSDLAIASAIAIRE